MSLARTILEADVKFAQLLHSIATKVMISKKIVKLGPTVCSHKIVYALIDGDGFIDGFFSLDR